MAKAIANTKSTAIKLTDTHLAMMQVALQRENRCLAPTEMLKGSMRRKAVNILVEAGLAREVRAKPEMPVWRRDDENGVEYSFKLTAAGARAIAIHEDSEMAHQPGNESDTSPPTENEASPSSRASSMPLDGVTPPRSDSPSDVGRAKELAMEPAQPISLSAERITAPRADTKIAAVLKLLARNEGATLDELVGATGWLPHTTRAALTGLRKRGYAIERNRENTVTRYRVAKRSVREAAAERLEQRAPDSHGDDGRQAPRTSDRKKDSAQRKAAGADSPSAA